MCRLHPTLVYHTPSDSHRGEIAPLITLGKLRGSICTECTGDIVAPHVVVVRTRKERQDIVRRIYIVVYRGSLCESQHVHALLTAHSGVKAVTVCRAKETVVDSLLFTNQQREVVGIIYKLLCILKRVRLFQSRTVLVGAHDMP